MIFYHGTSKENWKKMQKEGILFGTGENYRYTYLTPEIEIARKFGQVVLEVEYEPIGAGSGIDNYGFNPPEGMTCWQFTVFVPILLSNVRVKEFNICNY
jgi:hypothetical protein